MSLWSALAMGTRISGCGRRVFPRSSWPCVSRPPTHWRVYHVRGGPTGRGQVAGTHKAMTKRAGSAQAGAGGRSGPIAMTTHGQSPPEGSEVEPVGIIRLFGELPIGVAAQAHIGGRGAFPVADPDRVPA